MEDYRTLDRAILDISYYIEPTTHMGRFIDQNKHKWEGQSEVRKFWCVFSCITAAEINANYDSDRLFSSFFDDIESYFFSDHCTVAQNFRLSSLIPMKDDDHRKKEIEAYNSRIESDCRIETAFSQFALFGTIGRIRIEKGYITLRRLSGYRYALDAIRFMIQHIDDFMMQTLPEDLRRGIYYEFLVALRAGLLQIIDRVFPERAQSIALHHQLSLALHKKSMETPGCLISRLPRETLPIIVKLTIDTDT